LSHIGNIFTFQMQIKFCICRLPILYQLLHKSATIFLFKWDL